MAPVHRSLAPQVGSLFVRASCILFSWPWLQEPLPSNILLLESLLKVTQVRVSVSGSRRFQLETGSRGGGQERAGPQAERVVGQKAEGQQTGPGHSGPGVLSGFIWGQGWVGHLARGSQKRWVHRRACSPGSRKWGSEAPRQLVSQSREKQWSLLRVLLVSAGPCTSPCLVRAFLSAVTSP